MGMKMAGSISRGRVAYHHDVRQSRTKNVDERLSHLNVTFVDQLAKYNGSVEDYINDKMQPIIDRYNEGKRPCRQIKVPYTEYREHNKNLKGSPLCYEFNVQIGEHDTLGKDFYRAVQNGTEEKIKAATEDITKTYKRMLDDIRIKYPHMQVVGAFLHMDEPAGTPHMHLQVVPFGGPEKGLPVQVSIGRALTNDGIERVKDRAEAVEQGGYQLAKWYNEVQEKIIKPELDRFMKCHNKEYELKEVQHGRKHLEVDVFKAVKNAEKRLQKAEVELEDIETRKKVLKSEFGRLKAVTEDLKANIEGNEAFDDIFNAAYVNVVQEVLARSGNQGKAIDEAYQLEAYERAQAHFGINQETEIELEDLDDFEH